MMTNMSKKRVMAVVLAGCVALGLSSCAVYDYPVYTSASVGVSGPGWSTSVAWTDARYDANGFPIFGYSYGQPVYGYTASGAAVFTFAALTAHCWVPSWGPAHWYCGHWHYPRHIHRVSCPPPHAPRHHHVAAHRPAVHHHSGAPKHHAGQQHRPGKPHLAGHSHASGPHHQTAKPQRPGGSVGRPAGKPRPAQGMARPHAPQRPSAMQGRPAARPAMGLKRLSGRPEMRVNRPSFRSGASRAAVSRHPGGGRHGGGPRGHRR